MGSQDAEDMEGPDSENKSSSSPKSWPLQCEFSDSRIGNWENDDDEKNKSSSQSSSAAGASKQSNLRSSFPVRNFLLYLFPCILCAQLISGLKVHLFDWVIGFPLFISCLLSTPSHTPPFPSKFLSFADDSNSLSVFLLGK